MTQEKKQELKSKIIDFISKNNDFQYLNNLNKNTYINNNCGAIEQLISALSGDDIISFYYETVQSNIEDSNTCYDVINYWSPKLHKAVLIEQEPADSFDSIEELIDAIVDWEEQCEEFESRVIIIDKEKPLAEELARITLELTAQPMDEPMDGDATQDLTNNFLVALDDLMGNA